MALMQNEQGNGKVSDIEGDFAPNKWIYGKLNIFCCVFGFAFYFVDWVLDIFTAYNHLSNGNKTWCYLTIFFIGFPMVIVNVIAFVWYVHDRGDYSESYIIKWPLRLVYLPFGLVLRIGESLWYGIKSRKAKLKRDPETQERYYNLSLDAEADCVLLRLIDSFLESVPQLMLQLYILLQLSDNYGPLWVSFLWVTCTSSLLTVSWSVTSFCRNCRVTDPEKENLSFVASGFLLFWQFFSIGSRVIAIVLFASLFKLWWIPVVCIPHMLLMFIWMVSKNSFSNYESVVHKNGLRFLLAAVYVFTYINDKDEPTRTKYTLYYTIFGFENAVMILIWAIYGNNFLWYYYGGIFAFIGFSLMGLITMGIYYKIFHPTVGRNRRNQLSTLGISSPESVKPDNDHLQTASLLNESPIEVSVASIESSNASSEPSNASSESANASSESANASSEPLVS